ncbi:ATP-binding protein [Leptolyngbya boryana CZ1]|jgi:PAS domain S-box-containing protein|uniref:Circadian input-output histidine kinase CikA n=2 Tax=Leptolyngbya boryana TaxID=1184 RepID=A0A1Z4JAV4_LEPBY|nr:MULTISPECIES: PAS domain-containing protein [Leptolyngbya]BAY53567.1 PAS/PAC sensor signal transduction histidine kinase [Leptolyngbya boryana NIES-2135]MBD2366573.1 PAS domain-containing protein [Leptolyngbya sp. FACHB-161]MBD2373415.1 PAS domain-containing protein [Leptolyngbya sp. FACHB-238]MBD2397813.1 PAS domain-containing protein [Leptolyngbya sp. FACHB-239]MBD2407474.1 PAS domain-containing protein [Leptolyngbya sp. FACHB-402]
MSHESDNLRDRQKIADQLDTIDERFNQIHEAVNQSDSSDTFSDYLNALSEALSELKVLEQEVCRQNQQLFETRHALEIERQRYQELFEFAPDGYLITNKHGKIQEANRAAAELFNIERKYIIGKLLMNFVSEEQRNIFRSLLVQLQSVDQVREWEMGFITQDRQRFEAALTIAAVKNNRGETAALRWILRDISARKEIESQLRAIQKQNLELIESVQLKEQFISTMSHELRTPLTAIIGFSNLLLRQFHQQVPPHHLRLIERIFQNGKHLLGLIEDILDFSNLRANRFELRLETFDLIELIQATVQEMRSLSEQKSLDLDIQFESHSLLVTNDRIRLKQIIVNLLSNAIKFTHSGSVSVKVEVRKTGRIAIVVQDTGIGIDDSQLDAIFQEFRQVDQSSTRLQNGTGLGLAITKSLTQLMGGTISVQSQVGLGSMFTVELPTHVASL